jgi:hypothetical protein
MDSRTPLGRKPRADLPIAQLATRRRLSQSGFFCMSYTHTTARLTGHPGLCPASTLGLPQPPCSKRHHTHCFGPRRLVRWYKCWRTSQHHQLPVQTPILSPTGHKKYPKEGWLFRTIMRVRPFRITLSVTTAPDRRTCARAVACLAHSRGFDGNIWIQGLLAGRGVVVQLSRSSVSGQPSCLPGKRFTTRAVARFGRVLLSFLRGGQRAREPCCRRFPFGIVPCLSLLPPFRLSALITNYMTLSGTGQPACFVNAFRDECSCLGNLAQLGMGHCTRCLSSNSPARPASRMERQHKSQFGRD